MARGSITVDDGCRIAYEWRERSGAPALVLSPSLGAAMALFDPQIEDFARHFSVLRYDPRGHGSSDVPSGGYSLDRLGRDVVELLDSLGIGKAHFLGVSLGGMTGQWLGYRAKERIAGLILANTSAYMGPPSGWAARIDAVLEQGMGAITEAVLERWFTPEFRDTRATAVAGARALLEATVPAGYAGCCAAIRDMDLRPTAGLIEASTLVVAGLRDPATPPEQAHFLAERITKAKLAELDAAHLSNVEMPLQFNQAALNFLADL